MIYLTAFSVIFVSIAVAVVFRSHAESSCSALVGRLFPGLVLDLDMILEEALTLEETWRRTHGLRGLYKRWRNSAILVQIVQLEGERCNASSAEIQFALDQATSQSVASWAALVSYVFLPWRRRRSRENLIDSLRAYRAIALHTHSLLAEADVPLCARTLARIL